MKIFRLQQNDRLKYFTFVLMMFLAASVVSAQDLEYENVEEEELEYEEEIEDPKFFNGINETRFKSSFDRVEELKPIRYEQGDDHKNKNDFQIFNQDMDMSKYQYQEDLNLNNDYQKNSNLLNSNYFFNQHHSTKNDQVNTTHGVKPIQTNPTGKSPTMDAVPDHEDDPNDVPLDAGVLVLSFAALGLGYKKYSK